MFKVFISSKSLERICLEEMGKNKADQNAWFLVLSKQNTIYIDKNVYEDWDYGDPLFVFSESYNVDLKESDIDFNSVATSTQAKFPFESQGVYLLDVSEDTANSIQNDYGIICQSTDDLTKCSLSEPGLRFTLSEGKEGHSWRELLAGDQAVPSNAIVIIDRYLFGYDNSYRVGFHDAISNIKDIMRCVLPKQLKTDYHIIIIYSKEESRDRYYNFNKLVSALEKYKNSLHRPYKIIIELMSIPHDYHGYEVTHDRRILSNYFIVSAGHHIKAFREQKATVTQDVRCEYAYSGGLRDISDPPIESIRAKLCGIQNIIYEHINDNEQAKGFVCETTEGIEKSISKTINRLVV